MSILNKVLLFVSTTVIPLLAAGAENQLRGYSGMAKLGDNSYIVVHDKKFHQPGNRVALLDIDKNGHVNYRPINISSWKHRDGQASDLESICTIPQKPSEFLMAESGYWDGKFGRIFHVKITEASAEVLQAYQLPETEDIKDNATRNNFEGITCIRHKSELLVILGERGGSKAHEFGFLKIGVLDYDNASVSWEKYDSLQINVSPPEHWVNKKEKRDIADLYSDSSEIIWAVASEDHGDTGPFRSVIYKAAMLSITKSDTPLFKISSKKASWTIDGFKIESLAAPAANISKSVMSIASEDENFGGIWRPLFPPIE